MVAYRQVRKALRPVRRLTKKARTRLVELPYLLRRPARGSAEWLIRMRVVGSVRSIYAAQSNSLLAA